VPFAGHPTIGTSWVLATEKRLPPSTRRFNLEEGIGPVEVTLEGEPARPSVLWMRHGEARFGPELIERTGFARALGLAESDLLAGAPVCTGSTGNTFLYIPLRDREVVDRARLDVPALLAAQGEGPNLGVFVFAPDPDPKAGRVYARMFAPHTSGVPEDPATGSASGPLGAYLVERGLVAPADTVDIVSEQGTRMGRPSFIRIRVGMRAGRVSEILVGGSVVPVIEGRLRVP
jgi:trans-2,3-dihydro-3-hydroxyanthranilate isomerase